MTSRAVTLAMGLGALVAGLASALAADLGATAPQDVGVACDSPVIQSFPSVWLGHFSGGQSFYPGPGGSIQLDWRDETLCFPSRHVCGRYIHAMRHDFHRPEGYFTCLPIR